MPVPHLEIRIVQRSKGKSAVAGAADQCPTEICRPGNALELRRGSGESMELTACKAFHCCPAKRSTA